MTEGRKAPGRLSGHRRADRSARHLNPDFGSESGDDAVLIHFEVHYFGVFRSSQYRTENPWLL
jgi:hypothetical protein